MQLRMKELREERGLTQTEAAKRAGLWQHRWSEYERDKITPGLENLRKIAQGLEVEIGDLISEPGGFVDGLLQSRPVPLSDAAPEDAEGLRAVARGEGGAWFQEPLPTKVDNRGVAELLRILGEQGEQIEELRRQLAEKELVE